MGNATSQVSISATLSGSLIASFEPRGCGFLGRTIKLELFEYVKPLGIAADTRTNNPGSSHIAFYVEDLHAAYEELRSKGVRFRSPPIYIDAGAGKGGHALYMFDPDGITVELYQPPKSD